MSEIVAAKEAHIGHHLAPFSWCFQHYDVESGEFMHKTKLGILQYVPIKLACTLATFILNFFDKYRDGEFAWDVGYPYIAFVTNMSQIWAMYCLVLFYHGLQEDLAPIKPLYKFLAVKLVVFFTFWQSVGIAGLVKIGYLQATQTYSTENISGGIQDFIICFEMLVAAICHLWVFPASEFQIEGSEHITASLADVLSPTEILHDVKHAVGKKGVGTKPKPKENGATEAAGGGGGDGASAESGGSVPMTTITPTVTPADSGLAVKAQTDVR